MYIATNEMRPCRCGVINVLPQAVRRLMCNVNLDEASEIRLIVGKPLCIRYPDGDYFLTSRAILSRNSVGAFNITRRHMDEMLERVSKSSLYSVKEEIRNGYITIDGGHRVGLAGTAVTENGSVEFLKDISAMNIRIAGEVIGAAEAVIDKLVKGGIVKSTLIISPPGAGKTTMLRDITRRLSYMGYNVAIADERCELAAMHDGLSSFDLGNSTSVLDNCPKSIAMLMLLRSMSPEVIVTDEIGTNEDAEAIRSIINSGTSVVASVHGRNAAQAMRRRGISEILSMFDIVISLSKRNGAGTIEEITEND